MRKQIDNIDKQIINLLQDDARISIKDIASKVFLSSPAVSARIERLENTGIITGYSAYVNPLELGYTIKAFVNLEVKPEQKKDFYKFIEQYSNVLECNSVTGDFSVLMEVVFKDTEELDNFILEMQSYGNTQTQIVFSTAIKHRGLPINNNE